MFNGLSSGQSFNSDISNSLRIATNAVYFTPASALSYMVFCLLYTPCLATIAVLKREVGKKWTIISVIVQFVLAYIISLIIYTSTNLILNKGIGVFLLFLLVFLAVTTSFVIAIKKVAHKKSCSNCKRCSRQKSK